MEKSTLAPAAVAPAPRVRPAPPTPHRGGHPWPSRPPGGRKCRARWPDRSDISHPLGDGRTRHKLAVEQLGRHRLLVAAVRGAGAMLVWLRTQPVFAHEPRHPLFPRAAGLRLAAAHGCADCRTLDGSPGRGAQCAPSWFPSCV